MSYAGSAFTVCDEGLMNSTLLEPTKSRTNYLRDSRNESPSNKQVGTLMVMGMVRVGTISVLHVIINSNLLTLPLNPSRRDAILPYHPTLPHLVVFSQSSALIILFVVSYL